MLNIIRMPLLFLVSISFPSLSSNPDAHCNTYHDTQYNGTAADCIGRQLQCVPQDIPGDLVVLLLQGNQIYSLQGNGFCGYPNLKYLNLESNGMSSLAPKAFTCLSQLETLNLGNNLFENSNRTFPLGVFQPLRNLRTLLLNDSSVTSVGQYPSHIFDDIPNLKVLGISWWPDSSQRNAFSKLHDLEELIIRGGPNCNLFHLDNDTFSSLEHLPIVHLNFYCEVLSMESSPFWSFPKLTALRFKTSFSSFISLHDLTSAFAPFVGKNMSLLDLSRLQQIRRKELINTVIDRKTAAHLLSICIDTIILSRNDIVIWSAALLIPRSTFTECIKSIDLSHNPIRGDAPVIAELSLMPNLQLLDISYSSDPLLSVMQEPSIISLACPGHLQQVLMRSSHVTIRMHGTFHLLNCTNLMRLDIGHIRQCALERLTGVPGLKYLDVSYCHINESFFTSDFVNNTEQLIMKYASFGFDVVESALLFNMKSLQELDLTSTEIANPGMQTFSRLRNVKRLVLKGNKFHTVPRDVMNMPSLNTLDLSNNVIRVISSESRSQLDSVTESRNLTLLLEGNMFSCSCETLDFASWLHRTKVNLDLSGNYSCVLKDGRRSHTMTFYADRIQHWRTCIGMSLLLGTVIVYFMLMLSILFTLVILKYYHNIEQYILNLIGYNVKLRPKRNDFTYDAYVCYADSDYQWPCHRLRKELQALDADIKLYFPDLDEPLGAPKAEAIIDALSSSWKVVIVISENTLLDDWSFFTLLSAVQLFSTHNVISNRIILLYKDATPAAKAKVPEFLLNVLSENYIVEFEDTLQFWMDLYDLIACGDVLRYS